jgi:hypothetical protein
LKYFSKIFLIIFSSISSFSVLAEYRVYQYYAHSKIQNLTNAPYEVVTSTLDPKSYLAYHGGREAVEVNLLRSWMCVGNTRKQELCTVGDGRELEEKRTK